MNSNAYIYIMTNKKRTSLYVGSTEDIVKRVHLHRNGLLPGFTRRYNIQSLVYYERCRSAEIARSKERALKAGNRKRKIQLIESKNPDWQDLYDSITQQK